MSGALQVVYAAVGLIGVPALLFVRYIRPSSMPWWLLLLLAAAVGWVSTNLFLYFHWKLLDEQLAAAGGIDLAPPELVDAWQSDGGPKTFGFLFGWLYGLIYLLPWLALYMIVVFLRGARIKRDSTAN